MKVATDSEWAAIVHNDQQADGQFVYGVLSTGIFCRPSCASRLPQRANVRIFNDPQAAQQAGLRPCKRCRPTGDAPSSTAWVAEIKTIIQENYQRNLTLSELAQRVHGAPYYLHHVFRAQTGKTPLEYLQSVRLQRACWLLTNTTNPVHTVATACGFQTAAYFSTRFKVAYGCSPRVYRQRLVAMKK